MAGRGRSHLLSLVDESRYADDAPAARSATPVTSPSPVSVVSQEYQVEIDNEFVVRGNAAVVRCKLPSFAADFVQVASWEDSAGGSYFPSSRYGN